MKRRARIFCLICAVTMLIALLSGCGNGTSTGDNSSGGTNGSKQTQNGQQNEQVTLRFSWWGSDARHQQTLEAMEAYSKLYPNITIEGEYGGYDGYEEKLMVQLSGGTAPDVIQTDPIWNAELGAQKDNFVDLATQSAIDMSQFDEDVISGFCTVNGIVIGLPMGINGSGLQINKSFMEKFGIDLNTKWTYEKVIEVGKQVHEQDPECYLLGLDSTGLQIGFMSNYSRTKFGKYWIDDNYQVNLNKEQLADLFTTMKELFDSGAATPLGESDLYEASLEQYPRFVNGQVGMVDDWSGTVSKYKGVIGADNYAISDSLEVENAVDDSHPYKASMLMSVYGKSKHVDEAVKFVNWFLNDEEAARILKDCRSIPASKSARQVLVDENLVDEHIMQMVENALTKPADPTPLVMNNSEIVEITKDVIQKVVFGAVTPEEGADELISRVTEKLDELKASSN